jgi:hypothetical protein
LLANLANNLHLAKSKKQKIAVTPLPDAFSHENGHPPERAKE